MPWTVRVENENGDPKDEKSLVLEFGTLPTVDRRSLCFQIESAPFYDTILNPVQSEILLRELDECGDSSESIHTLKALAKGACNPHSYLRFIGD